MLTPAGCTTDSIIGHKSRASHPQPRRHKNRCMPIEKNLTSRSLNIHRAGFAIQNHPQQPLNCCWTVAHHSVQLPCSCSAVSHTLPPVGNQLASVTWPHQQSLTRCHTLHLNCTQLLKHPPTTRTSVAISCPTQSSVDHLFATAFQQHTTSTFIFTFFLLLKPSDGGHQPTQFPHIGLQTKRRMRIGHRFWHETIPSTRSH